MRGADNNRSSFVSVGTKLATFIVALLAVVSVALSFALVHHERKSLVSAKVTAASMVADYLGESLAAPLDFGDRAAVENELAFLKKNKDVTYAIVEALDGKMPPAELNPGESDGVPIDGNKSDATVVRAERVVAWRAVRGPGGKQLGRAIVHFSLAPERQAYEAVRVSILGASILVAFALGAILIGIMRRLVVSPLDRLVAAAKRLESGDSVRVEARSNDELGRLAHGFNAMAEAIKEREMRLEARNRAMRLVLDNVDQALVTVRADGMMDSEYSAAFQRFFGAPAKDAHFAKHLGGESTTMNMLHLTWEAAVEDIMPLEVVLDQAPKVMARDGRRYTLGYKPLSTEGAFAGALVVITDVTAAMLAMEEQEQQREYVKVFERAIHDPNGLMEFVEESQRLMDSLSTAASTDQMMRIVHTIKGNAAHWEVASVSKIAHQLETFIVEEKVIPTPNQLEGLEQAWTTFTGRVAGLLQSGNLANRVDVTREDLDALMVTVQTHVEREELERAVDALRHEPTIVRFERMRDQANAIARKLGKPTPVTVLEPNGVRMPASRFSPLWQSLVHLVRNGMDHGIEPPDVREKLGKPRAGMLVFRSLATPTQFIMEIRDDGAGIDWELVRTKARAAGRRAATREDLEAAVFSPGFSTHDHVSDISGRGVGMSAVRTACEQLGGTIEIQSELGIGTTIRLHFPRGGNDASWPPDSHQRSGARPVA